MEIKMKKIAADRNYRILKRAALNHILMAKSALQIAVDHGWKKINENKYKKNSEEKTKEELEQKYLDQAQRHHNKFKDFYPRKKQR
tara:strand:+ start:981 stop:1238 length:258 start_codon:yes stop_codon:yes gene_type:complete